MEKCETRIVLYDAGVEVSQVCFLENVFAEKVERGRRESVKDVLSSRLPDDVAEEVASLEKKRRAMCAKRIPSSSSSVKEWEVEYWWV